MLERSETLAVTGLDWIGLVFCIALCWRRAGGSDEGDLGRYVCMYVASVAVEKVKWLSISCMLYVYSVHGEEIQTAGGSDVSYLCGVIM